MSEIVKTEAIVISKLDYGNTSKIVTLFTHDFGKLSMILKGGRDSKSKTGKIVDTLNHIQVVFYNKEGRDLQILTDADLLNHFVAIKEDYDKIIYAQAVIELIKKLLPESEVNKLLFKGTSKILNLMNEGKEESIVLFGRYLMFFVTQIGYQLQLENCCICGKTDLDNMELSFDFENGILCSGCSATRISNFKISAELFYYLMCLKNNKNIPFLHPYVKSESIKFMERFLKFHIQDFQGIEVLKFN